jgi:hypothetical protein
MIKLPKSAFFVGLFAGLLMYSLGLLPPAVKQAHDIFYYVAGISAGLALVSVTATAFFEMD